MGIFICISRSGSTRCVINTKFGSKKKILKACSDRVVFPDELEVLLINARDPAEEGEIYGSSFSDAISGKDEDGGVFEYISSELTAFYFNNETFIEAVDLLYL
ncbi:unnamed protein product, partial [Ceratitis capitata]